LPHEGSKGRRSAKEKAWVVALGPIDGTILAATVWVVQGYDVDPIGVFGSENKDDPDWAVYHEMKVSTQDAERDLCYVAEVERMGDIPWRSVEFDTKEGLQSVVVRPKIMAMGDDQGKVLAFRLQLPITLAYAVTVHKQLGMTMEKMLYDMRDAFCSGQIYTALSRNVDSNNVFIGGKVKTNVSLQDQKVLDFMKEQVWVDIYNVADMEPVEQGGEADETHGNLWFNDEER
jgi:hypothetical protein